jgi:hypothetical protein
VLLGVSKSTLYRSVQRGARPLPPRDSIQDGDSVLLVGILSSDVSDSAVITAEEHPQLVDVLAPLGALSNASWHWRIPCATAVPTDCWGSCWDGRCGGVGKEKRPLTWWAARVSIPAPWD